jgi:hypothetical protein
MVYLGSFILAEKSKPRSMAKKGPKRKKKKKKVKSKPFSFHFPGLLQWQMLIVTGGFLLAAFGLYWTNLDDGFILDDKIVISENIYTKEGVSGWWDHLTSDSFQGYFKGERKDLVVGGRYRPLSLIVFSAIYQWAGEWTVPYHVVNITLYALTCALLFYLFQVLLTSKRWKSSNPWYLSLPFLAALLYLFHPIHIEAVANIKGLDEILTFFLSLLSWLLALQLYNRPTVLKAVALAGCFFLALLAKENAITFLAVIPLSYFIFGRPVRNNWLWVFPPLFISAALYLILRYQVLGFFLNPGVEITDILNNPFYGLNGAEHFGTVMLTWLKYLGLLIIPHPLVHDYYPYAIPIATISNPMVLVSAILNLGLIAWGLWAGIARKRIDGFAILFYFITFSIVSNLFFTVGTFMNERFVYISSFGFSLLLAYGLTTAARKWLRPQQTKVALPLILLGILVAYSWKTYDRLPDWTSYVALNQSAVEHYPTSARSTLFMGTALFNEAMEINDREKKLEVLEESEYWIDQSLSVFPELGNRNTRNFKYFNAYKMKAGVASEIYKLDQQLAPLLDVFLFVGTDKPHIPYLLEFLDYIHRRSPDREMMENFYHELAYQNLGVNKRNLNYAMTYLNKGLEYLPNSAQLLYDKGRIFQMAGRASDAQTFIQRAQAIQPQIGQNE